MQMGAGQVSGILALAAAAVWRAVTENRWLLAGAAIGLLCALTPFFGTLLLWLLFAGRLKAAAMAVVVGAGMLALSIATWGLQPQLDWFQAIREVSWFDSRFNMSWAALAMVAAGARGQAGYPAIVAATAVVALASAVLMTRVRPNHAILPLCLGSIIATPLGWLYYLCVPGPLLMRYAHDGGRVPLLAWLLWIPLPLLAHADTSLLMRLSLGSVYAWGMLILTASVIRRELQASNA
jgi:glycosyl transferase family 87